MHIFPYLILFTINAFASGPIAENFRDSVSKNQQSKIEAVLSKAGFSVSDFKLLDFHSCDTDPDKYLEGVAGQTVKPIENKDFSIPRGSSVVFCDNQVESVAGPGVVRFNQIKCKESFNPYMDAEDTSNKKKAYECTLFADSEIDGFTIPESSKVLFNRSGGVCFSGKKGFTVGGVRYQPRKMYKINGKNNALRIKSLDECWK